MRTPPRQQAPVTVLSPSGWLNVQNVPFLQDVTGHKSHSGHENVGVAVPEAGTWSWHAADHTWPGFVKHLAVSPEASQCRGCLEGLAPLSSILTGGGPSWPPPTYSGPHPQEGRPLCQLQSHTQHTAPPQSSLD